MKIGWPFGEYPRDGVERLGPNVLAYYGSDYPVSNAAIVSGSEARLVFDANIARFARALRSHVDAGDGPPLQHLVLSHYHDDHTFGAMHFAPPARTYARAYTRERLEGFAAEDPATWREDFEQDLGSEGAEEIAGVRIVVPDTIVEADASIELGGGVVVHLNPVAEAHTRGDLWAFVEPDGVALCGDLWFKDCEPYMGSGSVAGALDAIARIRETGARVHLPGHGGSGTLAPQPGQDPVERYCRWLLDQVAEFPDLTGPQLAAAVRARYEQERDRPNGVAFPLAIPGFLEESVKAAERDRTNGRQT